MDTLTRRAFMQSALAGSLCFLLAAVAVISATTAPCNTCTNGSGGGFLSVAPPRWKGLIFATALHQMESDLHLALRLRGGSQSVSDDQSDGQSDAESDDQSDGLWTCTNDLWTCECGWGKRHGGAFEDLLTHVRDDHGVVVSLGRPDGPHFAYCNEDDCERQGWSPDIGYAAEPHGRNYACEASLVRHLSAKHNIKCTTRAQDKAQASRARESEEKKIRRLQEALARKAKEKKEAAAQGIAHFLAVENIGA